MPEQKQLPILCLDFDGVIHRYDSGWQGIGIVSDPPVDGAIEFIVRAVEYFEVHIFSSRSREPDGIGAMKSFIRFHLEEYWDSNLYASQVMQGLKFPTVKPPAFISIDDRCLLFTGKFMDPKTLLDFKPWNNVDISNPEDIAKEAKETNGWKV